MSHDLRTPLTLIAEPVEQLAAAGNLTPRQRVLANIANKNVRILRRLINQILDFRKYENGKLDLYLVEARMAVLFGDWAESFNEIARRRDIRLTVDVDLPDGFTLAIDAEKMERVFFNLMSNAFKYTPDNGRICFKAMLDGGDVLTFSVGDTGRGIPAEDLGNIFDRFYQVDKVHPDGSGIGLSLAKAFVELHDGEISVTSEPGKGSEFTVTIPVRHVDCLADGAEHGVVAKADVVAELGDIEIDTDAVDGSGKPLLLVIDDNEDIRHMLAELLGDEYSVCFARDGREGVRKASRYVPDLIVCDVMMPGMDGFECCRRIKEEVSTSHIPVLMLTACSMDEQRVQGYDSGADGYVSKPFNADVLRSRCRSLVENRRRVINVLQGDVEPVTSRPETSRTAAVSNIDDDFYRRFIEIVQAEMGDPDLNVESLASRLGLGRSQFYRKIKALTNYTPVELLRRLRLKRSRDLLATTSRSISEIAYEVGFSTPAYFTRCYREAYGETPSELRDRLFAGS